MSGPGPMRPATILPGLVPHREAGQSTLNTAIQTIKIVHDLVPISVAKQTFLDAAVDAGRLADAIDGGFIVLPNVAILLTTRTTVLPPNLRWVRLRVPALEASAACEAFKTFYSSTIE
ncbi:hypothetical protein H0H92_006692 [Tricholoma furcatifolium]|nr:hypothetical protein H0H92_006692 [Tricholoma furcatifolium]